MSERGPDGEQADAPAARVPFGRDDVAAGDKAALVGRVFTSVAGRYDLMNDLMSLGVHRLWKRQMIAALEARPETHLLDLAGGTGDIAERALAAGAGRVTVCDINGAMLAAGRRRAWDRGIVSRLAWVAGDAERLPFAASRLGACTIAFGLRNVTRPERALSEIARVLAPGGRFLCLEFSPRVAPALAGLYDAFSRRVIPALGEIVAGDRAAYDYLVESIRRFPEPERLRAMMAAAGFGGITVRAFSGGIAVLHAGWRI